MTQRVLHVSHSAALSGAERALLRLLSRIDRDRFEPLVVLPNEGPLRAELAAIGVRTYILPICWWIPATHWSYPDFLSQFLGLEERWQAVADLAITEGVHLIHSNTVVTIEGGLAAAAVGIPHVWHSRGLFELAGPNPFPPKYFDVEEFVFPIIEELSDQLVCVSRAVLEQSRRYLTTTACSVIPDGFDPQTSPAPDRSAFLAEFDLPAGARVILCVGGIQRRKGQLDLVEAFSRVAAAHPDAFLLLCGDAGDREYVDRVVERISRLGLGRRVRLAGFRRDIPALIHHSDLLVHPSHSEGFGLAVLEAMSAGKAVVATRSGGPDDIIEDGVSGLLVPPRAPDMLAEAMSRVLANPELRLHLGDAARSRAMQFTVTASARQFEDLLQAVLSVPGSNGPEPDRAHAVCRQVHKAIEETVRSRIDEP